MRDYFFEIPGHNVFDKIAEVHGDLVHFLSKLLNLPISAHFIFQQLRTDQPTGLIVDVVIGAAQKHEYIADKYFQRLEYVGKNFNHPSG